MTGLKVFILSLICLVAGTIIFTMRFSDRGEGEKPLPVTTKADLTLKNIYFVGEGSGLREWELEAKGARHFQKGKMTILEDIKAAFYVKEGGVIRLKGDRGKILHGTKDIELQGNIVVFTPEGYQLTTDGLHYFDRAKQIRSSQRVDIAGNGLEIAGEGMSIDLVTGKLTMGGRVETVLSEALKGWKGMLPQWNQ